MHPRAPDPTSTTGVSLNRAKEQGEISKRSARFKQGTQLYSPLVQMEYSYSKMSDLKDLKNVVWVCKRLPFKPYLFLMTVNINLPQSHVNQSVDPSSLVDGLAMKS